VNGRLNDGRVTAVWGLSDGRVTAVRESENHGNQYGTHVTRNGMGERDSMDAINVTGKMSEEGLTLKRGSIMSKKQEEKGYNRSMMYKLNVLASARVVCNIMGVQVRGRTHRELYS
jgi:hypothetical protein